MQLPCGKARRVSEQAGHRMRVAIGVLKALAEDHVASAFAMDRAGGGKSRQPVMKRARGCERASGQFGIAARQPAAVAVRRGRLIGERREPHDFGPHPTPTLKQVRIDETECLIGCQGNALPRRREPWPYVAAAVGEGPRPRHERLKIEVSANDLSDALEPTDKISMLARLH